MSKKRHEAVTYRSPSGRFLEYAFLVRDARRVPGVWFLAFPAAPRATYKAVKAGYHQDLKLTDGVIEAQFRNEHIHEGAERGDVYVRFMPNEEK